MKIFSRRSIKHLPTFVRYSPLCVSKESADRQLQESFRGLWPKLVAMTTLFEDQGLRNFSDMANKSIVAKSFGGCLAFASLQNPLLRKYAFDPADFLQGAETAFSYISRAKISKDFIDFASESIKESESEAATLLRQSVHWKLFETLQEKAKSLKSEPFEITVTDFQVQKSNIIWATTRVVDETYHQKLRAENEKHPGTLYPLDSVLAIIDVSFEAEQAISVNIRNKSLDLPFISGNINDVLGEKTVQRLFARIANFNITAGLRFQGCLSSGLSQQPVSLDWMVSELLWEQTKSIALKAT